MFIKAIPVWGNYVNYTEKLNRHLIFRETAESLKGTILNIAAADFYRLTVNGEFVGFGPARTAKGYARVDSYDLSGVKEADGKNNEIVIEVAGYCCKSMSTVLQNSFLCAELKVTGEVTKYTGRDFECFENARRVRKAERYSVQRHFGELYDAPVPAQFSAKYAVETIAADVDVSFIPRRVPFASYNITDIHKYLSRGKFSETADGRAKSGEFGTGKKQNAYSFDPEKELDYGVFPESEVKDKPYRYVGGVEKTKTAGEGALPVTLSAGEWIMVNFDMIMCGFIRFRADVKEDCDLVIAFSELCENECFTFREVNMQGVTEYKFSAGDSVTEETFEPYSFRHVSLFVKSGSLTLMSVGYRSFERNMDEAVTRKFKKPVHNEIYNAALRTFAHNAVDLFTDCPSRERAGWLCDSFFMGRAEFFLYGKTPIEDAFLENYVLYEGDGSYPAGALPMCYPSTPAEKNKFIPQWNIWYVLEVCEYLTERRPDIDKELFRSSVMGVTEFLSRYENADRLLENLPSWNFVEWSSANTWTQDVNYPTNFLYAAMLSAVSKTFSRPELSEKAELVRKKAVELSFNGELFVDHSIRNADGTYVNQKHISEACQYYAILYGGIDIDAPKYKKLKEYVINDFSNFDPKENQFCAKNAFIGLYLRMNVLMNMKDGALLAKNLDTFCTHMSRITGTLWESKNGNGSLDHGFASYVALTIPLADSLPN